VTLKTGESGDYGAFYPTDVMETGYDILPFWVMRMLMMGIYLTGKVPFKNVYLHGLIRDEKGQKMSKSKGNVINPIELVDKYGADALRMTLLYGVAPGSAISLSEDKVRGMRNFSNKIWNAARYVINRSQESGVRSHGTENGDVEFMRRLDTVVKTVTKSLNEYRLGLAAETVYNEFWHWFCDEAIEKNKAQEISDRAIFEGLTTFLKLLHPFMPFVTEAVWTELGNKEMLITSQWPK
jgi:valyl-tRNA synthetase